MVARHALVTDSVDVLILEVVRGHSDNCICWERLPTKVVRALRRSGIATRDALVHATALDIVAIRGLGARGRALVCRYLSQDGVQSHAWESETMAP